MAFSMEDFCRWYKRQQQILSDYTPVTYENAVNISTPFLRDASSKFKLVDNFFIP
jgi:hypothetical protein